MYSSVNYPSHFDLNCHLIYTTYTRSEHIETLWVPLWVLHVQCVGMSEAGAVGKKSIELETGDRDGQGM